jgi:hypothetical protein
MDIPALITAVIVDVVLTGIVVYAIQKRIENRYAKSLYEFQQKFSISYPKTLEVMEILNQKFQDYRFYFDYYTFQVETRFQEGSPRKDMFPHIMTLGQYAISLEAYFQANRIHLPDDSITEFEAIVAKLKAIDQGLAFHIGEPMEDMNMVIDTIRRYSGISFENIDPRSKHVVSDINEEVQKELLILADRFERHYKSVINKNKYL